MLTKCRNSTGLPITYWGQYQQISQLNAELSVAERLWAAWFAWMQNDVLATGIMSFVMHEFVYFGRSLPWIFIDSMGIFKNYKIQGVSTRAYGKVCSSILTSYNRTKFLPSVSNGTAPSSSS